MADPEQNTTETGEDSTLSAERIKSLYIEGVRATRGETNDYWLNSAFLIGKQWLWYNQQTKRLDELVLDPDRVQATINKLWPASRNIISKLLQRELTFEVLPSASDDATLRGAATSEAVLHDVHTAHNWEALRTDLAWGTWKGGTAAICVDWDPNAGGIVGDITAKEDDNVTPVYKGDTVETALSISEFVVEPGSRVAHQARWWIKAQVLPPRVVQSTFQLAKPPPADASAGLSPLQQKLLNNQSSSGSEPVDLTLVLTYYERPNHLRPEGAMAVVVDSKIVGGGVKKWAFPFKDRLNFAIARETEIEGRWTGETVMSMARPVQVAYNASWSNILEHMKQAGNARMMVPASSIAMMENLTDMPGEMVPYPDGMSPPSWSVPPSMPQWWVDEPDRLSNIIDDIIGVHDVSRGEAPVNIESGYGLSVLSENDSTPLGKLSKDQAACFSQVATMVLELYASMVKETRTSMVRSAGDAPEAVNWSGKDLVGQTTAIVPPDAILPRSRAAMQQTADKMVQMQLIQSVEEYSLVAELPGARSMIDRLKPDVAKARRENGLMALGQVCVPAPFDDHQAHIAEHNVFRKSVRYERLAEEVRKTIDNHIQAHTTMAAEQAGQSRAGAAIDPMAATIPQADGRPTLDPSQLPPEALNTELPGADDPALTPEMIAELEGVPEEMMPAADAL